MSPRAKGESNGFSQSYTAALKEHLALRPGTGLRPARRIGRRALASGLDAADLIAIHDRALVVVLARRSASGDHGGLVQRAAVFFIEALRPFEDAGMPILRRRLAREIRLRENAQKSLLSTKRNYAQLLERSDRMQAHLRRLSHELVSAHEDERKKISRELHDEVGETLTAVNVKLAALTLESAANTKRFKTQVASTQRLVERSMNAVHRFARQLRPPLLDDLGLIPALRSHLREFAKRTRIPVHVTAFVGVERLDGDKKTVLFRVAQEALINIDRHARASKVNVSIVKLRGDVLMSIHDDGQSFNVERALMAMRIQRLGLLGMRERLEMVGGRLTIDSAPGRGTTVHARIPFGGRRRRALGTSAEATS